MKEYYKKGGGVNMSIRELLKDLPTESLVGELKKREGVETEIIKPYEKKGIKVEGPAIILKVID